MDIRKIPFFEYNTVIVGSGAAGLNAAVMLYKMGERRVAIVTEGLHMGTSRNTGSDKQTYYKLTQCGKEPDSIWKMAKTLFDGGCMDGDTAMAEAAGSLRAFYHLVDSGVPFPFNRSGEYVGYKTDHDPLQRGISAGPLTSKYMTICLEKQVLEFGIPIYDGYQAIKLLTENEEKKSKAVGILALNKKQCQNPETRFAVFSAVNVIWATGGEAGMYQSSVYPESQTGGMGVLLTAGAKAKNLTEAQFGIASVAYRWNLSGTFQQCLPRYVSTAQDGSDEREFMQDYFETPKALLAAAFLKGYQWPFDPQKIWNEGSSLIDLLVYQEMVLKGRIVYLDFIHNPSALMENGTVSFEHLIEPAKEYLEKSDGFWETPFERLKHMNPSAVEVYSSHQIDLSKEYLEIAVCAQHINGGIDGNQWWESNLSHLFPIGEVNGSHGVYRPGGSALNAGQVGGIRASQYIIENYQEKPKQQELFLEMHKESICSEISFGNMSLVPNGNVFLNFEAEFLALRNRMTRYGACIRTEDGIRRAIIENREQWKSLNKHHALQSPQQLKNLYKLKCLLISQFVTLQAMKDYGETIGISRGSYLVYHLEGAMPKPQMDERFRNITKETDITMLQEITYHAEEETCNINWRPVRPLLEENTWFENVWKDFRENAIIK